MEDMVIAGIIAEYNPFHNGHAYLVEQVRAAGATHIVAVMSGNYVQRGGPACASKIIRANAAVACGIDLVLELPLPYAMATAERFAYGGLSLLKSLGCVDVLAFGSECGDIDLLVKAAQAVTSPYCEEYTKNQLQSGITYARARQKAVETLYGEEIANVLASPNNILAVEYLKQIIRQDIKISPFTIPRQGSAHDSDAPDEQFASASHLRNLIDLEQLESIRPFVPSAAYTIYEGAYKAGLMPFGTHSLNTSVVSKLRNMTANDFALLPDISEGLENRLFDAVQESVSLDGLYALAKTKRYTLSRIRRLVWNAFLGVRKPLIHTPVPYARVLSFGRKGLEIFNKAAETAAIPISHSLAKLESKSDICADFVRLESSATDQFVLGLPTVQPCGSDFTNKITMK